MKEKKEIIKCLLEYIKGFAILFVCVIFLILLTIDLYYDIKETFFEKPVAQETEREPAVQETRPEIVTEKIFLEDLCYGESKTSGTFGMGSGVLSENTYYVAYKILEDGGKMLIEIPTDGTVVYETLKSGEKSYLEIDKNNIGFVKARRIYIPEGTKIPYNNMPEEVKTEP